MNAMMVEGNMHENRTVEGNMHENRTVEGNMHENRTIEGNMHKNRTIEGNMHKNRTVEGNMHKNRTVEGNMHRNRNVSIPKRYSDRIFKQSLIVLLLLFLLAAALDPEWFIEGEDIQVTVPEYKVGDTGNYRTSGDYRISGSTVFTISSFDITSLGLKIGKDGHDKGYMNVSIEDQEKVQNGFGETVTAYSISRDQEFPGTVSAAIFSNQEEQLDAFMSRQVQTYYLGDIPFRTDVNGHFDYDAGLFIVEGDSDTTIFPNDPSLFENKGNVYENPVRDVFRNITLKKGDNGIRESPGLSYNWKVIDEDRFMKRDCLVVEFDYDNLNLDDHLSIHLPIFEVGRDVMIHEAREKVWISDGISMPLKRSISISGQIGSLNLSVEHIEEMVEFNKGEGKTVMTEESDPDRPWGPVHLLAEKEEWEKFPLHGNKIDSSIPADFNITTAFDEANGTTQNLTDYLANNPESYLVHGKYNESNETGLWNLTLSAPENETGYTVNATRHTGTIVSGDHGERDLLSVDPGLMVTKDRDELDDEVITWSSAEDIFRNNTEVNRTAFISSSGRMDLDHNSFGIRTDLWFPIDLLFSFNIRHWDLYNQSPYAYFIRSEYDEQSDGDGWFFYSGIDAFTGQVLFVTEYSVGT